MRLLAHGSPATPSCAPGVPSPPAWLCAVWSPCPCWLCSLSVPLRRQLLLENQTLLCLPPGEDWICALLVQVHPPPQGWDAGLCFSAWSTHSPPASECKHLAWSELQEGVVRGKGRAPSPLSKGQVLGEEVLLGRTQALRGDSLLTPGVWMVLGPLGHCGGCRGPHVPQPRMLGRCWKLLGVSPPQATAARPLVRGLSQEPPAFADLATEMCARASQTLSSSQV